MENPHPGFAPSGTHGYRRLLAGNLLNAQGNSESSCESAKGFTVVGNNPLSYTDPSGEGIFGDIFGFLGNLLGGSWGRTLGTEIGNGIDAAIWGPNSDKGIKERFLGTR